MVDMEMVHMDMVDMDMDGIISRTCIDSLVCVVGFVQTVHILAPLKGFLHQVNLSKRAKLPKLGHGGNLKQASSSKASRLKA